MTIQEIKSQLTIEQVLSHYSLSPNKNNMLRCPFHNDKTPSLQIYPKSNTYCCFSANCTAGTGDVINFIQLKENSTKHQAIEKAKTLLGVSTAPPSKSLNHNQLFKKLQQNISKSPKAQAYLKSRHLSLETLEVGYNATGYKDLKNCIIFPLKDQNNNVVSFYGRSVQPKGGHYYQKNRQGLYPNYPLSETKILILTESIIDCATLQQHHTTLNIKNLSFLALYGTNGLTTEHLHAIQQLKHLSEIIIWLDGDEAGEKATQKHSTYLQQLLPEITITTVNTPTNEDINSLLEGHSPAIYQELLKKRSNLPTSKPSNLPTFQPSNVKTLKPSNLPTLKPTLELSNLPTITYTNRNLTCTLLGGIKLEGLDRMRCTLHIKKIGEQNPSYQYRNTLDLYNDEQLQRYIRKTAERLELGTKPITTTLFELIEQLEAYRLAHQKSKQKTAINKSPALTTEQKNKAILFGQEKDLLKNINQLISTSGVVGEEQNRLFLFIVAQSHRMPHPLNTIIQGSSGSGKSHLIHTISQLMPQDKVKRFTRLSDKSLYNFGTEDLVNALLIVEDLDGMSEEAEYALRELQSSGRLSSAISHKESEDSGIKTIEKTVRGPIASIVATTRGEIYHDNATRVFFINTDESQAQTERIIAYKNQKAKQAIKTATENQAQQQLQQFVQSLAPYSIQNQYLQHIQLPVSHQQQRRLHELLDKFSQQITLIHQHQRERTKTGELITTKADMQQAVELLFETIILKVDELDGSLRDFYEKLKEFIEPRGRESYFFQREIRHSLKVSKTQLFRYIKQLEELEYIQKQGTGSHGATKYQIVYWDDNQALRKQIKETLNKQLENL